MAGHVSTANLANLVSTSYLNTQLGSTMTGISQNFYSSNIFTSSLITSSLTFGTGSGYLFLPNTVMNSLSVGILYASTIVGFTPGGGSIGGGIVSTANLANLVSTSFLDTAFGSTLTSLENQFTTSNLITPLLTSFSTISISAYNTINIDTFNNMDINAGGSLNISSSGGFSLNNQSGISIVTPQTYFFAPSQLDLSPVILSSIIFADINFSTSQITTDPTITNLYWNGSQLNNQGGGGGISQANLTSTVIGLGTVGYISTAGGGGGVSQADLTSSIIGLGTTGYVSTPGANGLFSTVITSTLETSHILNTSEYLFMDSPVVIFGKPDFSSFYPIAVSSIGIGNGQLTTDATDNLYWNSSQVNSQRGFVTIISGNANIRTYDPNITGTSIILATPYGDLSDSGNVTNVFWIDIDVNNLEWIINIQNTLSINIKFSYNILQY